MELNEEDVRRIAREEARKAILEERGRSDDDVMKQLKEARDGFLESFEEYILERTPGTVRSF